MSTQLNTDFDLDGFLADLDLGDKGDVLKEVLSNEKNKKKLQESVLRQSDYDKRMNESKAAVQKQLDEVAAKQASLDALITQNIAYKGKADEAVAKAQEEVEKAQAKLAKAASKAGYDLDDEFDDDLLTPRKAAPAIDVEKLKKELGLDSVVSPAMLDRLATGHINLTLELDEIKDTYQDLHGKRLSRAQKEELLQAYNEDVSAHLRKHPQSQPPPLEATAVRLFNFDEKRAEMSAADRKKLEADIRADERRKIEQERMDEGLPAPRRTTGPNAPIFNRTRKEGEKPVEGRGQRLAMETLLKSREGAAA